MLNLIAVEALVQSAKELLQAFPDSTPEGEDEYNFSIPTCLVENLRKALVEIE